MSTNVDDDEEKQEASEFLGTLDDWLDKTIDLHVMNDKSSSTPDDTGCRKKKARVRVMD